MRLTPVGRDDAAVELALNSSAGTPITMSTSDGASPRHAQVANPRSTQQPPSAAVWPLPGPFLTLTRSRLAALDLALWKRPQQSGAVLGAATVTWYVFACMRYTVLSLVAQLLLLAVVGGYGWTSFCRIKNRCALLGACARPVGRR